MPYAKRGIPDFLPLKRQLRSNMTAAEQRLWRRLRLRQFYGLKFRRQHGIGPYIVDFYCPDRALVIEVDGNTHAEEERLQKDRDRDNSLRRLRLCVIRYQNSDIMINLEGVREDLSRWVKADTNSPTPSLQRRREEGRREERSSPL